MTAEEIRALAEDFKKQIKADKRSVTDSIQAMQAMMLAEIAAQLSELNYKLDPLIVVGPPKGETNASGD